MNAPREPALQDDALNIVTRAAPLPAAVAPASVELDLRLMERSGHLVRTQARSALADEFRHVKRVLLQGVRSKAAAEERLALIMVTSAMPGEGKTFCAINLAMSLSAEIDTSVLLVDADVVRPDVPQRLGIRARRGLLDLLADPRLHPQDLVLATNVPKLSVLPAGTRNDMSTELLASEAMDALLESLIATYPDHVVVFDSPPLLPTTEARVLAERVGQVVLVVRASSTPRSTVLQAFDTLASCPNVMSLLNLAQASSAQRYGGY